MEWGAYYGLATRRPGLTRWQRGDMNALVEIPTIIADIDEPPEIVLPRIKAFPIPPSCIISSGHGVHLYWILDRPTIDMQVVNAIHRSIAKTLKGDYLTAATALRLPGSLNTKHNGSANCEVLTSDWSIRYSLCDFADCCHPSEKKNSRKERRYFRCDRQAVNRDSQYIQDVTDNLIRQGFKWRGTWLNGSCPNKERHKHADRRASFGFNTATGWGYCFVCGVMQPKLVCHRFSHAYS